MGMEDPETVLSSSLHASGSLVSDQSHANRGSLELPQLSGPSSWPQDGAMRDGCGGGGGGGSGGGSGPIQYGHHSQMMAGPMLTILEGLEKRQATPANVHAFSHAGKVLPVILLGVLLYDHVLLYGHVLL